MQPEKRISIAYLLWLPPLGLFGVHRLYLRKRVSANFFMASIGLFGIGWLIDSFVLPFMVNNYNKLLKSDELYLFEEKINDESTDQQVPDALPDWIDYESAYSVFVAYLELILSMILMGALYFVLLKVESKEVYIYFILIYFIILFPIASNFLNQKILFSRFIINLDLVVVIQNLLIYFHKNKPTNIFIYLFFPLTFPLFLFNKKYKPELVHFQRIWLGGAVFLTIFMLDKFLYKEFSFAAIYEFVGLIFISSGVFISLTVLMAKSSFRRNEPEFQQVSAAYKFISLLIIFGIFSFNFYRYHNSKKNLIASRTPIEVRIQNDSIFKEELEQSVKQFSYGIKSYKIDSLVTNIDQINNNMHYYLLGNSHLQLLPEVDSNYINQVRRLRIDSEIDSLQKFKFLLYLDDSVIYRYKLSDTE